MKKSFSRRALSLKVNEQSLFQAAYPMSFDFTPMTERPRLQQLGYLKPHLLGSEYTHLDYCRRPLRKDLGKSMLYRFGH